MQPDFSQLPPPPKGQTGMTLDQFKHLPPPPKGQQGVTLDQIKQPTIPQGQTGIKGLALGAVKGAVSGVEDIGRMVTTPLAKAFGTQAPQGLGLTPTGTTEKLGALIPNVASYAIPQVGAEKVAYGVAKNAPNLVKAGAGILSRGATGFTQEYGKTGDVTEGLKAGAVSALPVQGALKVAGNIAGSVGKATAGYFGRGTKIIDEILANPKAAKEALRDTSIEGKNVYNKNIDTLKKYVVSTDKQLQQNFGKTIEQVKQVVPNVDLSATKKKIDDALIKTGVFNEMGQFTKKLIPSERAQVQEAYKVLFSNQNPSIDQVEKTAQALSALKRGTEASKTVDAVIGGMAKTLRNSYIEPLKKAGREDLANFVKDYAVGQGKLETFKKMFGVSKDKILTDKQKLIAETKLKNLLSGDKPSALRTLKELGMQDVVSRQAGLVLQPQVSRTAASFKDNLTNVLVSPRLVGELTAYYGEHAPKILNAINNMDIPNTLKYSLIELLKNKQQ